MKISLMLLSAFLLLIPLNSHAFEMPEEFRLNFSMISDHSKDYRTRYRTEEVDLNILGSTTRTIEHREYFDEENPGIGIEIPLSERAYLPAGIFDNSLPGTTMSVYAGLGYDLVSMSKFSLCVEAVAASGYDGGSLGGDLCSRINIAGNSWVKLHYAPGESFDMGTDVYALEYQIVFN